MPIFKNDNNNTWYVMARYTDWKGERKQKCKRGFQTRREAQEWEHTFQMQTSSDMDMSFEAFAEIYTRDIKPRLRRRHGSQRSTSSARSCFHASASGSSARSARRT